jgi:hypothetical protein
MIFAISHLPIGLQCISRDKIIGVCIVELENFAIAFTISSRRIDDVKVNL